jgi:hypothetical protein
MTAPALHPVVITAHLSKAHVVRQVATELGLSYNEAPVEGREDLVKFFFGPMDEAATRNLATRVPREAYAYNATIGGARGGNLRIVGGSVNLGSGHRQ